MADERAPSIIDRWAPVGFLVLGVAMIVVAATAGFAESLAVAFVTLGTALVVLGGLAGRLVGPFRFGPGGIEGELRETVKLLEAVAEEQAQADALKLDEAATEDSGDWFLDYQQRVQELGPAARDPFVRAALLQRAYQERARQPR